MVESLGGEIPEIQWPRGIPDQMHFLLQENRHGAKLSRLVSRALRSESDLLSSTFRSHPSIDCFINLASDLNHLLEFVDSGRASAVQEITNDLIAEMNELETSDILRLLEQKLKQYRQLAPGIEINEASDLPRHLAETMQRVARLIADPTGFGLVDYLAEPEQSAYTPNDSNFEQENLGRKEGAKRYKDLYNLLFENGATPDN